jgi:hypothetical protein
VIAVTIYAMNADGSGTPINRVWPSSTRLSKTTSSTTSKQRRPG